VINQPSERGNDLLMNNTWVKRAIGKMCIKYVLESRKNQAEKKPDGRSVTFNK